MYYNPADISMLYGYEGFYEVGYSTIQCSKPFKTKIATVNNKVNKAKNVKNTTQSSVNVSIS
jgi:hypothetical protein